MARACHSREKNHECGALQALTVLWANGLFEGTKPANNIGSVILFLRERSERIGEVCECAIKPQQQGVAPNGFTETKKGPNEERGTVKARGRKVSTAKLYRYAFG